jgi:predicted esterase
LSTDSPRTAHHIAVPRTARYYVVGEAGDAADASLRDLWVVCHGYGQLAAAFVTPFEKIARPWRRIVAPEALSRFYLDAARKPGDPEPRVGATWMTREDREREIDDQVTYLDALVDRVRPHRATGGVRLRAFGFSQGVATVVRWLDRGRVRADEVILWAGSFPPDVDLAPFAARVGDAPVVLVVGTRDQLAPWAGADVALGRLVDAGLSARLVTFDGGHRLDDATLAALAADR